MSTFAPQVDFSPADVSDAGLAELRRLAIEAMSAAPRFGTWLHQWTDAEQARRGKREATCTHRHHLGVPLMAGWSHGDVADAFEAVSALAFTVADFSAHQFTERLALCVSGVAVERLRNLPSEGSL